MTTWFQRQTFSKAIAALDALRGALADARPAEIERRDELISEATDLMRALAPLLVP